MNRGIRMMMLANGGDVRRSSQDYGRGNPRSVQDGRDSQMAPRSEWDGRSPYSMHDGGIYDAFYDRSGRRHYDNGRFAPMRSEYGSDREVGFDTGNNGRSQERGRNVMYLPDVYGGRQTQHMQQRDSLQIGHASGDIYEDGGEYHFKGKFGMMGRQGEQEKMPDHMDQHIAEEWTHQMQNEDGTEGPHWKPEQVKQLMQQKSIDAEFWDFYAALNMMYSDYCKVAKKFNANNIDFYVDMAKAWLEDEDASAGKAKTIRYYQCIAK